MLEEADLLRFAVFEYAEILFPRPETKPPRRSRTVAFTSTSLTSTEIVGPLDCPASGATDASNSGNRRRSAPRLARRAMGRRRIRP